MLKQLAHLVDCALNRAVPMRDGEAQARAMHPCACPIPPDTSAVSSPRAAGEVAGPSREIHHFGRGADRPTSELLLCAAQLVSAYAPVTSTVSTFVADLRARAEEFRAVEDGS